MHVAAQRARQQRRALGASMIQYQQRHPVFGQHPQHTGRQYDMRRGDDALQLAQRHAADAFAFTVKQKTGPLIAQLCPRFFNE
jgi:hypothetical protein